MRHCSSQNPPSNSTPSRVRNWSEEYKTPLPHEVLSAKVLEDLKGLSSPCIQLPSESVTLFLAGPMRAVSKTFTPLGFRGNIPSLAAPQDSCCSQAIPIAKNPA